MPPKRKAASTPAQSPGEGSAPAKRRVKAPSSAAGSDAKAKKATANVSAVVTKGPVKSKAKTMKDRILYVLANATSLMGLPTLKKRLIEEFAVTESKVFNSNVKKALAELSASPRDDFGKIGGSYHAGESSAAYQAKAKADAEDEDAKEYMDQGLIKCCYCGEWCPPDCELGEDSIARGSKYRCFSCDRIFWTWISDGYTVAHEVSYKKSSNY